MATRARNLANLLGSTSRTESTIPISSIPEGVGGASPVANAAALPTTGNTIGDLKITSDKKALYIWDGTKWERVQHGINVSPRFVTLPPSTLFLSATGLTSTITAKAIDEAGFPVTYDWDGFSDSTVYTASSLPNQITNITESNGVFTLTPSTNTSHAGAFTFRTKATDGAQVSLATTTVNLSFSEDITTPNTGIFNSAGTNSYNVTINGITSASGMGFSSTLRIGKYYFELEVGTASSYSMIGLVDDAVSSAGYNATGIVLLYAANGNKYVGNVSTGLGAWTSSGDTIMFAYDTSTREVWLGKNGSWYEDPNTTSSSFLVGTSSTTAVKLAFGNGATSGETYTGTINVGSNVTYAVPTGFNAH